MTATEEFFKTEILARYKAMYRVAAAILDNNRDDAADAVQMAMTRLWERRAALPTVQNTEGYCLAAVRTAAIDLIRSRRPADALTEASASVADDSMAERVEAGQQLDAIGRLLRQLPDNQQRVVRLSAYSGCSNTEIARITGLTEANVRTLLSRARTKLRFLYSQQQ